jgi:TfoX/Sxy family transcriptional regulator of competence genes
MAFFIYMNWLLFFFNQFNMAYNEALARRIEEILQTRNIKFTGKKMFGGLCFLVDDKMLLGVEKNRLMVRIDPEDEATAGKKKGASPMDFTGRVMKGFLFVDENVVDLDKDLEYWVDLCLKYNPKAKGKSKSKSKEKNLTKPETTKGKKPRLKKPE